MNKRFNGYIYFDGLELMVHHHILEKVNNKQYYYIKTPKIFQISELFEMCCFINRESIKVDIKSSLIATNINYPKNMEFFNDINDELNIDLYSSELQFDKSNYLANSLYFLNQNNSDYELIYNKDSQKYYSELFTRENVENDNYKLLGGIYYFNFTMVNKGIYD